MIAIIAQELQINKDEFNQFFHEEAPQIPIKTEFCVFNSFTD
jgi:hypothetical protein